MLKKKRHLQLGLLIGLATAGSVAPSDAGEWQVATETDSYVITVGGFGAIEPRFEGARRTRWGFQPFLDFRKSSEREWLSLPRDSISFSVFENDTFRAGFAGNGRWGRDTDTLVRGFRRISSMNLSIEAGAFAEYWPVEFLRTRAEVRNAVVGASGVVAELTADAVLTPLPNVTLTAGPRWSVADREFMRSYYEISPEQSVRSGLPTYAPSAGTRTVGAGSMLKYKIAPTTALMGYVEYQRISDTAAGSPLISQRGTPNQTTVGVGLTYSFEMPR